MSLGSLPLEVICLIASKLPRYRDILSLVRCNHTLYDAVFHLLYKQDKCTQEFALRWLIENGFEQGIQLIISRYNLDINQKVKSWSCRVNTPLLLAVRWGRTNIVELILRNGALVNFATDISPLECAATLGDYNMTSVLLQHGAHADLVNEISGETPLGCALELGSNSVHLGSYSIVSQYFCHWNDKVECKGEDEFIAVIQLLLAHGADPSFQSDQARRYTCLHRIPMRRWSSTEKLVRLFLDYGADLDAQDHEGQTPLHEALSRYAFSDTRVQNEFVEVLLRYGADVNFQDGKGKTPLHHVLSSGPFLGNIHTQKQFVEVLLRAGADVNLEDCRGETPLGIRFENPGGFHLMLTPGASTRCRGRTGGKLILNVLRAPVRKQTELTKQHQINTILIELLLEHGARADQIIDGTCPLDLYAAGLYQVLKYSVSKRKLAIQKPPPKELSQAPKNSGRKRKAKKHKILLKPTRQLPPRKARKDNQVMEPSRKLRSRIIIKA